MKINGCIYPYNIEARKLPVHLTGIGGSEWQNHVVRPEGYQWHQILFSAGGKGVLKFDNTLSAIDEGSYFFLPANYPHEYFPENGMWNVTWVTFDGYAANHILSLLGMTKPIIIRPEDNGTLEKIFGRMYTAQNSDKLYCDFTCSGLIYEYIIEFRRHIDDRMNKSRSERSKLLINVLEYIDGHFNTDFPMTYLAEIAGVTPQHLCRIFKDSLNVRPNEYLAKKRIQEAKRLMQNSNMPIADIAAACGYPNAGYFSTVFKKLEGITPAEYRSQSGIVK